MNNVVKNSFIFLLGAAAGGTAAWFLLKTKYEQIADAEIESVKETFYKKLEEIEASKEPTEDTETVEDLSEEVAEYENLVEDLGYNAASEKEEKGGSEPMMKKGPRVVTADEFNTEDYEVKSLNYYADGVLTDAWDEVIEEYEYGDMVGEDFASHFGDDPSDPDTVYICNDEEETYYEILKDNRKFSDLDLTDYD